MKRLFIAIICIIASISLNAQECPSAFKPYTTAEYIYSCQGDINTTGQNSHELTQRLRRDALSALAEQFEVRVESQSVSELLVEDGISNQVYTSLNTLTTDVTLKLAHTKESYDRSRKKGWAIAYINKAEARDYYLKEYQHTISKINTAISEAEIMIGRGYKAKAREEKLRPTEALFALSHEALAWLSMFGYHESDLQVLLDECGKMRQAVTEMMTDLEYGTSIFIQSTAKINNRPYPAFEMEIKGQMEKSGCHFVDNNEEADWIVEVNMDVTRTQHFQNMAYFCWVDGDVSVTNAATGQQIYRSQLSAMEPGHPDGIKGNGDTRAYEPSARDAYKQAAKIVAKKVIELTNK